MFIKYLAVCVLLPHLLQAIIVFPEYEHMHVVGFSNNKRVCGPTVTKLENTFISSCKELKFKDCQGIYKDFSGAFAGRDPTTIRREDYNDYFKTLPVTAKANENLFWSGTFSIVAEISKNNLGATVASSANADASVIINRMETKTGQTPYWCGTVRGGVEGIDQTSPNCDCTPTDNFWAEFSSLFAKAANGVSFFLGNGQRSDEKGAYSLSSFFATIEIPSMNAKVVDKVVTIVVHQKGKGESCTNRREDSLIVLEKNLTMDKGIKYECRDVIADPNDASMARETAEFIAKYIIAPYQTVTADQMQELDALFDGHPAHKNANRKRAQIKRRRAASFLENQQSS